MHVIGCSDFHWSLQVIGRRAFSDHKSTHISQNDTPMDTKGIGGTVPLETHNMFSYIAPLTALLRCLPHWCRASGLDFCG